MFTGHILLVKGHESEDLCIISSFLTVNLDKFLLCEIKLIIIPTGLL